MNSVKELGCATILGIIAVVLVIAIPVGMWGARVYFADEIGRGNAEIQLNSAEYRIQAYDHFFDMCASVQNAEISIDAQTALLETASESDKSRISQNIAALHSTRGNGINQYNADASKDYTLGQFQNSKLPYKLDPSPYVVGGAKTQCAF